MIYILNWNIFWTKHQQKRKQKKKKHKGSHSSLVVRLTALCPGTFCEICSPVEPCRACILTQLLCRESRRHSERHTGQTWQKKDSDIWHLYPVGELIDHHILLQNCPFKTECGDGTAAVWKPFFFVDLSLARVKSQSKKISFRTNLQSIQFMI